MRNRIVFVLVKFLYAFPFIIFFPPIVKSLYVFLFFLLSVGVWSDIKLNKGFKLLIASCSIFFVYALSLLYSSEPLVGIKMLETKLGMIVIPLSFLFFLSDKQVADRLCYNRLSKNFLCSSALYSLTLLIYFFIYKDSKYPNIYTSGFFQSAAKNLPLIGEHHIYISLILAASMLFFLAMVQVLQRKIKTIEILAALLVLIILWALQSRAILVSSIFVLLFLYGERLKKFKIKKIIFMSIIASCIFFLTPQENNRFLELTNYFDYDKQNSASQRLVIYDCSWELLIKKPIKGVGIGTTQKLLKNCFNKKTGDNSRNSINTHNQYLDFFITIGPWGLLLFFWLKYEILNIIKTSINKRMLLSVFMFFSIALMFENFFERQTGVIFIYFFTFFLIKRCIEKN